MSEHLIEFEHGGLVIRRRPAFDCEARAFGRLPERGPTKRLATKQARHHVHGINLALAAGPLSDSVLEPPGQPIFSYGWVAFGVCLLHEPSSPAPINKIASSERTGLLRSVYVVANLLLPRLKSNNSGLTQALVKLGCRNPKADLH